MSRLRAVTAVRPAEIGRHEGLSYALWPARGRSHGASPGHSVDLGEPCAGVVILHGAGSQKESHYDFARSAHAVGLAAIAFDARGHGESGERLDARAIADVAAMAHLLSERTGATSVALRGSSMGGFLALAAARSAQAGAVVAICPAGPEMLLRGLRAGSLGFEADRAGLEPLLESIDLMRVAAAIEVPVLLLHAEGDERVPVTHSRELVSALRHPESRLVAVPGGHHRSLQHDEEMQAFSLRFVARALGVSPRGPGAGRTEVRSWGTQ